MTDYQWELADVRRQRSDQNVPRVTVQRRGNMGMNAAAYDALGSPRSVVFLIDRVRRAFAIRPAGNGEAKSAYPVRKQQMANSYVIGARSFTSHLGLADEELKVFEPKVDGKMLIVDLNAEVEDVHGEE